MSIYCTNLGFFRPITFNLSATERGQFASPPPENKDKRIRDFR